MKTNTHISHFTPANYGKIVFGGIFSLVLFSVSAQKKPNVLFIAIDDLNDYVNCMNGSIKALTPNIDRLAKQGVLFTNAHCQAPICGPSRASIMTGLYPSSSGNYFQLKDTDIRKSNEKTMECIFLPDYFEQSGYRTMGSGKIFHQGDGANVFDEYGIQTSYGPLPKGRMNYDPRKFPGKTGLTATDWGAFPENDSLMPDYITADWVISRLQKDMTDPFFLAAGFVRPHVPWHVPQKWYELFPLENIKTPPFKPDDFNDIPTIAKRVSDVPMMPTTEEFIKLNKWKEVIQAYLACIAFVDAQVGRVLEALEKSKYADNTVIVLWADHGYHLGEKNRFAKHALWERDTRTVLIFKPLGKKGGHTCSQPVQLIDIYPTLLDLCMLPPNKQVDGHSLAGLIRNPKLSWPYPALSMYGVGNLAVRNNRFRLIQYEDGGQELYDLKKDPNEWTNLISVEKYQKVTGRLTEHIPDHWSSRSKYCPFTINEYFKKK